ncbi:MAG: hypothetical protein HY540_00795 [Deltaproteobacteria bacterium]|nr:hypothetical protein [Deltaproteobacteria bacterium]
MATTSKIDWKAKPQPRELVMFGSFLIILFMGFVNLALTPQGAKLKQQQSDLNLLKEQVASTEKIIRAFDAQLAEMQQGKEKQLAAGDERLQRILQYRSVNQAEEAASAIALLSDRHFLGGMVFKGSSIGTARKEGGLAVIPFEVQLEGRYGTFLRYLENIERVERPLLIARVDALGEPEKGFLLIKLFCEIYLPE